MGKRWRYEHRGMLLTVTFLTSTRQKSGPAMAISSTTVDMRPFPIGEG